MDQTTGFIPALPMTAVASLDIPGLSQRKNLSHSSAFFKIFLCGPFCKPLLNLLQYSYFFFGFRALRHVRS